MTDLEQSILVAWRRLRPPLLADPAELSRRLARRHTPTLLRPPRAWCLAVRASDTRITPATAAIVPEDALNPPKLGAGEHWIERDVLLDARLVRMLTAPVRVDPAGVTMRQLADALGCRLSSLHAPRYRRALLRERRGRRGRLRLFRDDPLDPSFLGLRRPPDPVWGSLWQRLGGFVPDRFEQTVARVPTPPHRRGNRRSAGWTWRCPRCGRLVRLLFCPIRPLNVPEFFGEEAMLHAAAGVAPPPRPPRGMPESFFACGRCHRVEYFSRMDRDCWNHLVSHLTGGLLYGREVPRPKLFLPERRRRSAYNVTPTGEPLRRLSPRMTQVRERLLKGSSYKRIAADLGITPCWVSRHAAAVYRFHHVHSREDLMRLHGITPGPGSKPRPIPRAAVLQGLLAGQTYNQIATATGGTYAQVQVHARALYREHGVRGRKALSRQPCAGGRGRTQPSPALARPRSVNKPH